MKRALVVYHSLFGNTKTVAMSLARGLESAGIETNCLSVDEVDIQQIPTYDFLAIGSPTHMINTSNQMKAFLKKLTTISLRGMAGFCFDTRNESRMNKRSWLILENSAARRIESFMKRLKMKMLHPRQSALVHGREGPLYPEFDQAFIETGSEIGQILNH
ncbi:MAG: flavodoxin family protein [Candidatus Hodarchaeota archaeon]